MNPLRLSLCALLLIYSAMPACAQRPLPDAPLPALDMAVNAPVVVLPNAELSQRNCIPFRNQPARSGRHKGAWCYYQPDTAKRKIIFQLEEPFGPRGIFMPAIMMGISYPRMADKDKGYPSDWTDGAGAFERNLGDHYARNASARMGELLPALAFKERVRYTRSTSTGVGTRIVHALAGTVVGQSDTGKYMPSFVNLGGAVGSGFVGMAYLPGAEQTPQKYYGAYNDLTHAGQRSIRCLGGYSTDNLFKEFSPEIVTALHRLHLPGIPHFPIWWTGRHDAQNNIQ